jgi:hypothetical protein
MRHNIHTFLTLSFLSPDGKTESNFVWEGAFSLYEILCVRPKTLSFIRMRCRKLSENLKLEDQFECSF